MESSSLRRPFRPLTGPSPRRTILPSTPTASTSFISSLPDSSEFTGSSTQLDEMGNDEAGASRRVENDQKQSGFVEESLVEDGSGDGEAEEDGGVRRRERKDRKSELDESGEEAASEAAVARAERRSEDEGGHEDEGERVVEDGGEDEWSSDSSRLQHEQLDVDSDDGELTYAEDSLDASIPRQLSPPEGAFPFL